jgi:protein-S-isoprenylcysteine O-methyltransferase Ste14
MQVNWFELKIPPPIVALVFAVAMWFVTPLTEPLNMSFGLRLGFALALATIGQSISVAGMIRFRRAKTTINPVKASAASSLVTGGIYRFTRNPMYVGLSVTIVAWAVFLASPMTLVFVPVFMAYIHRFQIIPEERVLTSIFGEEYEGYKNKVRRWV